VSSEGSSASQTIAPNPLAREDTLPLRSHAQTLFASLCLGSGLLLTVAVTPIHAETTAGTLPPNPAFIDLSSQDKGAPGAAIATPLKSAPPAATPAGAPATQPPSAAVTPVTATPAPAAPAAGDASAQTIGGTDANGSGEDASVDDSDDDAAAETDGQDPASGWVGDPVPAQKSRPLIVPEHKKVDQVLKYYLTKRRFILEQGYKRSGRYLPMIQQIFSEEGIPPELAVLGAVESNYNPTAHSWARAAGLWQFMRGTARKYGLRVNLPWYDERLDPVYSTRAAARLLADLHDTFGNWELALAGYNAGVGRVARAIQRAKQPEGEENFWTLRRLPRETKGYVPSFFALARIYADPVKYGLNDLEVEPPMTIEAVKIEQPTTLKDLADRIEMSGDDLARLNPAWKRGVIPPVRFEPVLLHVPQGQGDKLMASIAATPLPEVNWREHIVARGETMSQIARMYHVPLQELMQMNAGHARLLSVGQSVQLPVPKGQTGWPVMIADDEDQPRRHTRRSIPTAALTASVTDGSPLPPGTYAVQSGDSLWSISQRYGVTVQQLKRWNHLHSSRLQLKRLLIVKNPETAAR
jgi:membrane-bound lytic murein transglycosylase D